MKKTAGFIIKSGLRLGIWLALFGLSGSCARGPGHQPPAASITGDAGRVHGSGIYGTDNRHDLFEETNPVIRQLALSTVAVFNKSDLSPQPGGSVQVRTKTYGEAQNLCSDERFREQDTAPFCTGFLIAPDTVVTAGHCVSDEDDCAQVSVAFGFSLLTAGTSLKTLEKSEVYSCAKLVHAEVPKRSTIPSPIPGQPTGILVGPDFAIFTLDRPVPNHPPLRIRRSGGITVGDPVFAIGHPSGLPLKVAGDAHVRAIKTDSYFTANLDTYGGNSGSPVFDSNTFEVEGILVRGGDDFLYRPDLKCRSSVHCGDEQCRGEDVMLISEIMKFLKN